jgi:CubicO group peptidase (beta-lactamase class C family)
MRNLIVILCLLLAVPCFGQKIERALPESGGMDSKRLRYADEAILQSIADGEIPGAVLAVVHQDKLVYLKAFGNKQVEPTTDAMEVTTVFDLASVTKSISTATSVMILLERGKLRLDDKVSVYVPEFKDNIRIVDLLTHTSGLPAYAPVNLLKDGLAANPDTLLHYIASCRRSFEPKEGFQYSCLNYITLQRIVETVSGQNLRDFAKANIFDVLGMEHTDYRPTGETLKRTAPTEKQADGQCLRGRVHDPLARFLNNGISGNAGLFSDAEDLALFSAALLNGGAYKKKRILSPQGVKALTSVPHKLSVYGRTPGWDSGSDYSSNQGDLLSPHAYGHTGYTGTSIVIDPDNKLAVILLTNRVHPADAGSGAVVRLRGVVANAVAASLNCVEIKKENQ